MLRYCYGMRIIRTVIVTLGLLAGTIAAATPADASTASCPMYEALLSQYSPGWSVARMSHLAGRESGCQPAAWNRRGHASGLLQITPANYGLCSTALGMSVNRWTLQDPDTNIRCAAAMYSYWSNARRSGYRPWQ